MYLNQGLVLLFIISCAASLIPEYQPSDHVLIWGLAFTIVEALYRIEKELKCQSR